MSETSREFGGLLPPKPDTFWPASICSRLWVLTLGLARSAFALASRVRLSDRAARAVAVLAALALAADYGSIRLSPLHELTVASLVCVFAAVVLGPLSGAVVATAGLLRDLPRRDTAQPILRWATWTSKRVLATVAAGLDRTQHQRLFRPQLPRIFAAVTAAFAVETIVGEGLNCVARRHPPDKHGPCDPSCIVSRATRQRAATRPDGLRARLCLCHGLSVERGPLRHPSARCSEAPAPLSAAARDDRRTRRCERTPSEREPLLCDCACGDT